MLLICIHIYLVLLDERGGFATWSCRSHFDMSLLEMFFWSWIFHIVNFAGRPWRNGKEKTPKSFDSEEKDARICKMGSGRGHRDGRNAAESSDLVLKQIAWKALLTDFVPLRRVLYYMTNTLNILSVKKNLKCFLPYIVINKMELLKWEYLSIISGSNVVILQFVMIPIRPLLRLICSTKCKSETIKRLELS